MECRDPRRPGRFGRCDRVRSWRPAVQREKTAQQIGVLFDGHPTLTAERYEQTKVKLRDLETRLVQIDKRTDLDPEHLASVRRSCKMMMREFLQEIKLYEAKHVKQTPLASA